MGISENAPTLSSLAAIPDESGQANRARGLFAVALAGILVYIALDAVVQSLPPHYSPISQAESDLAVGPFGYIMTVNFINRGLFSLSFLFALFLAANSSDTPGPRFRMGGYLLGMWSVGSLVLAAFPTDVPPMPISWHGAIHLAVAVFAFLGGAFGALYLSRGMANNKSLSKARGAALPLAYLSVLLFIIELFGNLLFPGLTSGYFGLLERMFLGSVLLWMGMVSLIMLERPRTNQG